MCVRVNVNVNVSMCMFAYVNMIIPITSYSYVRILQTMYIIVIYINSERTLFCLFPLTFERRKAAEVFCSVGLHVVDSEVTEISP